MLLPVAAGGDEVAERDEQDAVDLVGIRLQHRSCAGDGHEGTDGHVSACRENRRELAQDLDRRRSEGDLLLRLPQGRRHG